MTSAEQPAAKDYAGLAITKLPQIIFVAAETINDQRHLVSTRTTCQFPYDLYGGVLHPMNIRSVHVVVVERDLFILETNGSKRISLRLFGALVVVPAPGLN